MARKKLSHTETGKRLAHRLNYSYSKFELISFVEHVSRQIGRPIRLIAWKMTSGLFGAWIKDSDSNTDYIFYDKVVPLLQKRQIILHELGHVLSEHSTTELSSKKLNAVLTAKLLKREELEEFYEAQLRAHQLGFEDVEAEAFANQVQSLIRKADQVTSKTVISKPLGDYLDSLGLI